MLNNLRKRYYYAEVLFNRRGDERLVPRGRANLFHIGMQHNVADLKVSETAFHSPWLPAVDVVKAACEHVAAGDTHRG